MKNLIIALCSLASTTAFAETTFKFAHSGTALVFPHDGGNYQGIGLLGLSENETKYFESQLVCGNEGDSYVMINPTGKFSISDELCKNTYTQMDNPQFGAAVRYILGRRVTVFEFVMNENSVVSVTKTSEQYKRPKSQW